jgi:aryl-alcohol dehydrogenase-like predicted oxidoreductase
MVLRVILIAWSALLAAGFLRVVWRKEPRGKSVNERWLTAQNGMLSQRVHDLERQRSDAVAAVLTAWLAGQNNPTLDAVAGSYGHSYPWPVEENMSL